MFVFLDARANAGAQPGGASGDNANANPKVDDLTVFNVAVSYTWEEATFRLRVNNLLNEEYNGFETTFGVYPAPKRNALLEVEWSFD